MTDEELVRRCCEGDHLALDQLVRRWTPRVFAVCRARIGRIHNAEDATQETMMRAIAQLSQLANPDKIGAWLRGIAIHVCADCMRKQSRQRTVLLKSDAGNFSDQSRGHQDDDEDHQHENEERRRLQAAIQSLAAELREPLLLFYFDEMTYEQIAKVLEISRATVNSRLARARQQLARILTKSSN